MPASSAQDAPFYLRPPPSDVRIANWALRDDPWRSVPMTLLGAVAAGGVGLATESVAAASLAGLAVGLALWRTLLPVAYEFGPRGVTQVVLGRRRTFAWLAMGGFAFARRGLLLFPAGEPTWWNASRSLFVLWGGKRDEIAEVVEYYLGSRLHVEEATRPPSPGKSPADAVTPPPPDAVASTNPP